jgi:phage tail protein X
VALALGETLLAAERVAVRGAAVKEAVPVALKAVRVALAGVGLPERVAVSEAVLDADAGLAVALTVAEMEAVRVALAGVELPERVAVSEAVLDADAGLAVALKFAVTFLAEGLGINDPDCASMCWAVSARRNAPSTSCLRRLMALMHRCSRGR